MSDLEVIQSPLLAALPGVKHAFFSRRGGVSEGIYEGLNVGRGSNDVADHVQANRRKVADWFGVSIANLNTCYQYHSSAAVIARRPWSGKLPHGDAVVTGRASIICGVLTADCAPILIVDPEMRLVAAAHAGWQGALGGVVNSAVETMISMGGDPARMVAAVGPCIAQGSYEVGLEFLERFETARPGAGRFFAPGVSADKRLFDLPGFVLERLAEAGVTRAEWVGRDTCAEADWFYSNRRAFQRGEPDYGRLLSGILLF